MIVNKNHNLFLDLFLNKNLRWRRSNNIDNIMLEDFSDMQADYPYTFNAHDLEGRPSMSTKLFKNKIEICS